MNKRQKEVLESTFKDEQAILKALEQNYTTALADIKRNIRQLQANPLTQSKAYQLEFQKQLEKQISGILDNLQGKNFTSIADYLNTCYQQGFLGSMYDMQGQGVPLILPIDQTQVLTAVQKTGDDFKLSNKLGVSTKELKKQVQEELTRGFASELTYAQIALNISNYGLSNMNRSIKIAVTEGHRVQSQSRMDSMQAAKKKGANIVKQWDATLDGKTRPIHRTLDGQFKELDEMFEAEGMSTPYPGGFNDPAEDCFCRCCLLQRARWAVKDEKSYQKWNNEAGGFIECSGYDDFKEKYLKILTESDIIKTTASNGVSVSSISVHTFERAKERGITASAIVDAFENPLHIGEVTVDSYGRKSQRFVGNIATANVNPDSGKVTTVWKTGKSTKKKYTKKGD